MRFSNTEHVLVINDQVQHDWDYFELEAEPSYWIDIRNGAYHVNSTFLSITHRDGDVVWWKVLSDITIEQRPLHKLLAALGHMSEGMRVWALKAEQTEDRPAIPAYTPLVY